MTWLPRWAPGVKSRNKTSETKPAAEKKAKPRKNKAEKVSDIELADWSPHASPSSSPSRLSASSQPDARPASTSPALSTPQMERSVSKTPSPRPPAASVDYSEVFFS